MDINRTWTYQCTAEVWRRGAQFVGLEANEIGVVQDHLVLLAATGLHVYGGLALAAVLGAGRMGSLFGRLATQAALARIGRVGGQLVVVQELIEIGDTRLVVVVVGAGEKGRVTASAHDTGRVRVAVDGGAVMQVGASTVRVQVGVLDDRGGSCGGRRRCVMLVTVGGRVARR